MNKQYLTLPSHHESGLTFRILIYSAAVIVGYIYKAQCLGSRSVPRLRSGAMQGVLARAGHR